jgi:hypothetical protein
MKGLIDIEAVNEKVKEIEFGFLLSAQLYTSARSQVLSTRGLCMLGWFCGC